MSNPIGHTFMYNIIILFIVIVFAFLAGTLSYYKAFKINNRIVYIIEKYEGYNSLARKEIDEVLTTFGYDTDKRNLKCDEFYKGMQLVDDTTKNFRYCIYVDEDRTVNEYFVYGVKTYMTIELPIVSFIRIPIFTKTNQIYKFTSKAQPTNFER